LSFWHYVIVLNVTIPNVTIHHVTIPNIRNDPEAKLSYGTEDLLDFTFLLYLPEASLTMAHDRLG